MLLPEYDLFFSLGRFCHTRILLEGTGLSRQCGPWDWSGTPVAEGVYKRLMMLVEGFDDFFRREDFVNLARHPEFSSDYWEIYRHALDEQWPHPCLFNRQTFSWYVHDGTKARSFEEQFDSLRQKYLSRAERFMLAFRCADRILAVYISNAVDQHVDLHLDSAKVIALLTKIREANPGKRVDLAMFTHETSKGVSQISEDRLAEGFVNFKSDHHFCPTEPSLFMRGYRMPEGITHTLRTGFRLSSLLSGV